MAIATRYVRRRRRATRVAVTLATNWPPTAGPVTLSTVYTVLVLHVKPGTASKAEWLRAWDTLATMKLWRAGGREFSLHGRVVKGMGHLGHDEAMEAGGREFSLHGRVVKGVGHLGHDEAMEAGGREFSLHGRVVEGVGHLGHDEAMEAGGREFDPRPG